VQPGVVWGELDAATQEHGLAVTGGEVSDTGVAGLTLGGGFGWLKRTCGLSCDNLSRPRSSPPTAGWCGRRRTSTRTCSGRCGRRRQLRCRQLLHVPAAPVGPMLYGGAVLHPGERAGDALRFLRDLSSRVPDEVSLMAALVVAPPAPEFPEALRGRPIVVIGASYHGDLADGEEALRRCGDFAPPAIDQLGPHPVRGAAADGRRHDASRPAVLRQVRVAGLAPRRGSSTASWPPTRVRPPPSARSWSTRWAAPSHGCRGCHAVTYRDAVFSVTVAASWPSADEPATPRRVGSGGVAGDAAGSSGGAYVNHLDADEARTGSSCLRR
jgi:hypothetical protein